MRLGSPPRVRGTVEAAGDEVKENRITPACAGNSRWWIILEVWCWDHPRVCGEQDFLTVFHPRKQGSPPRVRGTGRRSDKCDSEHRITPACAGNSVWRDRYAVARQDHPRVCGEQIKGRFEEREKEGSPPRVRGTVRSVPETAKRERITPACAGNSE